MNADQQRRVRDLFEAALDKDDANARDWLAREAADDDTVRDEVLSLFDHHSRAQSFLVDGIAGQMPQLFEDDAALAPGTVVGGYTIVRELGRGGMGRVYLASDAKLGRQVALKALAPHLVSDPRQRERLRREARAAAALTHPGICTVYALEEVDGELYIVTEYVDGRTLREEIVSGARRPPGDIFATARELASALASAHARGVVHRDLKPENVMRTVDGRLKILDFGLARIEVTPESTPTSFATHPGVVMGTPAYMSPEQINGQTADARADIFAFGVLLYEYACGVHPFHASTPLAIVARVLDSEVMPLGTRVADVGPGLANVIGRCLEKRPSERYATAADLVDALDRAVDVVPAPSPHALWWSVHQVVICALYIVSAAYAWRIKAWMETPITVSIFLALGTAATIGGVLRGHLVFTERVNRAHLARERRRTTGPIRLLDLLVAFLMCADGVLMAGSGALAGLMALSLGLGIALASVVLEPATTRAAFGEDL